MFADCYKFIQPLNNWSVNFVHNLGTLKTKFSECQRNKTKLVSVAKNKNNFISVYNVTQRVQRTSHLTNMNCMFYYCKKLKSKPNWYKP